MRYYELIIMMNPLQELKVEELINYFNDTIKNKECIIHRLENWGCKKLAYSINKFEQAFYILMYIECNLNTLIIIKNYIKSNKYIIRNIILRIKK